MDSTAIQYVSMVNNLYQPALKAINNTMLSKAKCSLTLHFDGSGRVSRITKTEDLH